MIEKKKNNCCYTLWGPVINCIVHSSGHAPLFWVCFDHLTTDDLEIFSDSKCLTTTVFHNASAWWLTQVQFCCLSEKCHCGLSGKSCRSRQAAGEITLSPLCRDTSGRNVRQLTGAQMEITCWDGRSTSAAWFERSAVTWEWLRVGGARHHQIKTQLLEDSCGLVHQLAPVYRKHDTFLVST